MAVGQKWVSNNAWQMEPRPNTCGPMSGCISTQPHGTLVHLVSNSCPMIPRQNGTLSLRRKTPGVPILVVFVFRPRPFGGFSLRCSKPKPRPVVFRRSKACAPHRDGTHHGPGGTSGGRLPARACCVSGKGALVSPPPHGPQRGRPPELRFAVFLVRGGLF